MTDTVGRLESAPGTARARLTEVTTAVYDRPVAVAQRSIDSGGRTLRAHAARGMLINGAYDVGLSALGLIRGFVLAALLSRSDYGVWGVLTVSLGVLASLKVVGISDKYVQQEESDQELAFQKAFTLEVIMTAAAIAVLAVAVPVICIVYGDWKLLAPGIVLLTVLAADALQAPFWIYYRQMHFARQRSLGLVEPVIGFVLAIGLAVAGLGYWALAIGVVAGAWAGAAVALITCPFRLRWRYDRGALRLYAGYSGPIFVATAAGVVLANATAIATHAHLGLAGVGAVALAANVTSFTTRVDSLVGGTLYPAICAMQDRLDLLHESFVKSNRLALMWAMPFGAGLALFADDLVRFAIGEKWRAAITLLRITGIVAAIGQIGFNWDDYFRARARTVPLAVASVASTVALLGVGLPLLAAHGLTGLAIGIAAGAAVHLAFRAWYLAQLFDGFAFFRHALRAILPTLPAAGVVLLIRALESGARSATEAVAELAAYAIVTVAGTWLIEGALVREALGYLGGRAR
jgi:O-antigen/teichoic acid export membrane protein